MKSIPFKVVFFFWMAYLVQTVDKMLPKWVVVDNEFVFCHVGSEITNHLLGIYSVVKSI